MIEDRGRNATRPGEMPARGWLDVVKRSWREMSDDNLSLIASGVAFYAFLAMVPLMGAIVLSYGLVAEPASVVQHFQTLSTMLPGDAARLIGEQLMNVVTTAESKKGLGLVVALALAFWGATKASGAIVTALNIAYDEAETRGFIRTTAINLAMVAGAVLAIILSATAIALFAHLDGLLPTVPAWVLVIGRIISWLFLALIGAGAAATLYRYVPDRAAAKWRWLTPGSIFAALGWGVLTAGFGIYVANFGNYNATYGSLGAVVVLLTWLYLSALVLLLGAELNAELEHQTAQDTTTGIAKPLGSRGAEMADTVATGHVEKLEVPKSEPASAPGLTMTEAVFILLLVLFKRPELRPADRPS